MGRRLLTLTLGSLLILGLLALRIVDPYPVQVARETSFDLYQQIQPRTAPAGLPVRIVDIDELSLSQIGQWPWPRATLAKMAIRLTDLGAAAIAFDIVFSEPERVNTGAGDAALADALSKGPTVLSLVQSNSRLPFSLMPKVGFAATGTDPLAEVPSLGNAAQPLASLAEAAKGLGVANLDHQGAGVARLLPLLWQTGQGPIPTLALEALRIALNVPTLLAIGDGVNGMTLEALRIGNIQIPTGPSGDLRLYYRPIDPETYLPASDLLGENFAALRPLVEGNIVFVGSSAAGLHDIRMDTLGQTIPGVAIHVQALEQILTQTFLNRADWVNGLELASLVFACLMVVLAVVFFGPLAGLAAPLAVTSASLIFSWWSFSAQHLLIDPSYPLFAILVTYAVMAFFRFAFTDLDRRRIRRAFGYYVEPTVLSQIEADQSLLRLGGTVKQLTVMFSDVRNFSALAERTSPAQLVDILNRLFGALGGAIVNHRGTIDKFMGDSVMAFWNAPAEQSDHALLACRAALSMRTALRQLNTGTADPIHIGIGLATGPALVGNMGFEKRFDYSCLGDTVNVASRIERACKLVGYAILVTKEVAAQAPHLAYLEAGSVQLKGMSGREPILLLVGDETVKSLPGFTELAQDHSVFLDALRIGACTTEMATSLRDRAAMIEPELGGFYDRVADRLGDFLTTTVPTTEVALD